MSSNRIDVYGPDGLRGTLAASPETDNADTLLITLENGREVWVPREFLQRRADGSFYLPLRPGQLEAQAAGQGPALVIPVVQEEVSVSTREVISGRVRIHKQVEQREETIDVPLMREEVDVQRVPRNAVVQAPSEPYQEGETLVIPIYEEVLVVEKRLLLKEELRVSRRQVQRAEPQTVSLRQETVHVEREESPGRPAAG